MGPEMPYVYPDVAEAYIDDARIHVAFLLPAEIPNPTLLPAAK